jgi:hypothetical protein
MSVTMIGQVYAPVGKRTGRLNLVEERKYFVSTSNIVLRLSKHGTAVAWKITSDVEIFCVGQRVATVPPPQSDI